MRFVKQAFFYGPIPLMNTFYLLPFPGIVTKSLPILMKISAIKIIRHRLSITRDVKVTENIEISSLVIAEVCFFSIVAKNPKIQQNGT